MKAIFRMKLNKYQNKTILKLGNISNRFLMRQRILLSDRFLCEATGGPIYQNKHSVIYNIKLMNNMIL